MIIDLDLNLPIAAHRDNRFDITIGQMLSDVVAIISLVGNDDFGLWARLGHHRHKALHIRYFASRQRDGNW